MKTNRTVPEVNAGSMADIAFLLLIFFLVTASIEHDTGFNRMLPSQEIITTVDIKSRNLLEVSINPQNDLMVAGNIVPLSELNAKVVAFLDNGGIPEGQTGFCGYCQGERIPTSSENPDKAIISLRASRSSDYAFYVSVQNEIIGAYNLLRNREGEKRFGATYISMVSDYNKSEITGAEKVELKRKIKVLQSKFPQKLVEPETINPN